VSGSSSAADPPAPGLPVFIAASLAVAYAGLIWWLSSQTLDGPERGFGWVFAANGFHYPLFGGLALLVAESLRPWLRGRSRATAWVVAVVFLYAVIDELHQAGTPGRSDDPVDVAVDTLGAFGFLQLWFGARQLLGGRQAIGRFLQISALFLLVNAVHSWPAISSS
jgi:hypothetical protein